MIHNNSFALDMSERIILKTLYENSTYTKKISHETIRDIENAYLASWPEEYHSYVRNLPEYSAYFDLLKTTDEIALCPEHGDFALNNILSSLFRHLIDFEFSRENQPSGFDLYAYRRTTYKTKLFWRGETYYNRLHELKFRLNNKINFAIDNDLSEVIVYPHLSDSLKRQVADLLDNDLGYNDTGLRASFLSCLSVVEKFFFVTVWNKGTLSGFAAVVQEQNILSVLKTEQNIPILYFNGLYPLALCIKYMDKNRLGFRLDHISKQSVVYTQFMRMRDTIQVPAVAVSMHETFKKKFEDGRLFALLGEISGTIDSLIVKDQGDFVSIFNRSNKKIILKCLRNRGSKILRDCSRAVRTGLFFIAYKLKIKQFITFIYQYPKIRLRWRKSRKKGGALFLKIGDFYSFIRALNQNGVDYVVLLGLTDGSLGSGENVDFLLKASQIHKMIYIASFFPGSIPCDVYFDTYKSIESYPYYPPMFAVNVLNSRVQNEYGCYVPDTYSSLVSLLFHITYHKGMGKGIRAHDRKLTPRSKYYNTIVSLIAANGLEDCIEFSLDSFHQFLKTEGYSMPYDLLVKWPIRNEFLDYIREREEKKILDEISDYGISPVVFLIRTDARKPNILEYIQREISGKFTILSFMELTEDQIQRAIKYTRGGNWVELDNKEFHLVSPYALIVCRSNPDSCFPKLDWGGNVYMKECGFLKTKVRKCINEKFPSKRQRYLIHSADSPCEALDYLKAIFPQTYIDLMNGNVGDQHLREISNGREK